MTIGIVEIGNLPRPGNRPGFFAANDPAGRPMHPRPRAAPRRAAIIPNKNPGKSGIRSISFRSPLRPEWFRSILTCVGRGIRRKANPNPMMTTSDIRETIETFLGDWDRQSWMVDNGEWSSEEEDAYILEGEIDPDNVADDAVALDIGHDGQKWDCIEGWDAYRHDDALYMRWRRFAWGERHARDLWVEIDPDFFAE